ncbi:MAG: MBL fold metallo-hydrolase [Desulfomonilia bacterium]|jgi:glyoxylase-like metal-dependent hydrolase (beta-lactamase superfamily II)|nr:MBL fold metallo-hydrolase [Deltaproteobacteria bacterium]MDX9761539.1 MBL fold metallo-hydrolase [Desulfomonilia bacterium]HPW68412.1 MBL fold metallo-hydrolase [Deltaproteobacteria bacterium]
MISAFPPFGAIHAIVLPVPGFGNLLTSNIYVLGTGPVTLIDTGPKFPGAFENIEKQLLEIGFCFQDIERIILTHGHIDHFGLTGKIIEAAGRPIPCHLHRDDIWRTSGQYIRHGFWGEEVLEFTRMAGMPRDAVERMKRRSAFFKNFCDPLEEAIPMDRGDTFSGPGFELRVVHTPGHSPGSCCLYESRSRVLFCGDHIIKHITPNPIMEIHRSLLSDPGYQSLISYEDSLKKVEELDICYAFSGHGEYIDDVPGLLLRYREHHESRKRQILHHIQDIDRPISHLVQELFPDIPESEIFLAVSEVYAHLEVLIGEGRARMSTAGPPALFRASGVQPAPAG